MLLSHCSHTEIHRFFLIVLLAHSIRKNKPSTQSMQYNLKNKLNIKQKESNKIRSKQTKAKQNMNEIPTSQSSSISKSESLSLSVTQKSEHKTSSMLNSLSSVVSSS